MKYVISPIKKEQEIIDFGSNSSVILSYRAPRSGRTEVINILCELLAGQRATEDSRPDPRMPWTSSASVRAYNDAGKLDFHALRYENGQGVEAAEGDLPDSSLCILGYSSSDRCGWYHAGKYLSVSGSHTSDWGTLVQALGLLACVDDASFRDVINECLIAAGLPQVIGGNCMRHAVYAAEFQRLNESTYMAPWLLTRSERAGIMQVCSQVIPWLLHVRHCSRQGVTALETCYCLIDDLAPGVNIEAVNAVLQRRFPNNQFVTLAFT